MKILRSILVIAALILGFTLATTHAEGPHVSGTASVDVMSNYIWRGFKLSNSVVVQPSVAITYGGFGANLWANYDTDLTENSETDLTVDYSFTLDKFSFDVGYIYYALDNIDDTQEIYLSIGYDILLNPTLTIYYDFDEGDGAYITASLGHDFDVGKEITLSMGALVSYNAHSKYSIGDYSDFHHANLSASLSIPVWKNITAGPKIAYSFPLSNDAKDSMESISNDGDKDILYGGINVTLSF